MEDTRRGVCCGKVPTLEEKKGPYGTEFIHSVSYFISGQALPHITFALNVIITFSFTCSIFVYSLTFMIFLRTAYITTFSFSETTLPWMNCSLHIHSRWVSRERKTLFLNQFVSLRHNGTSDFKRTHQTRAKSKKKEHLQIQQTPLLQLWSVSDLSRLQARNVPFCGRLQ